MWRRPFCGGIYFSIRSEKNPYLVVVLYRAEGQRGRHLRGHVSLRLLRRSEVERSADIDEQHDRQFAFLLEELDVGAVQACCDVPVDVAHVVAVLVFAHFREGHASSAESRVILSCEDVAAQSACADLDLAHLAQKLLRVHQGTSTLLMTWEMMSSVVTLAASAS